MNQGIDYGMGLVNIDKTNGIRFGVISQHSLAPEFVYDDFEPEYGSPTCPKCGNKATDNNEECDECEEIENDMTRRDYHCHNPRCVKGDETKFDGTIVPIYCFYSDMAYGDEPLAHVLNDSEYLAHYGNDGFGVWIEKSPYYTYARLCSPCAPGAGDLDSPIEFGSSEGPELAKGLDKVYCFGHECFEDSRAPYRVFRVVDDSEVIV